MPTFSRLALMGTPATKAPPSQNHSPGQENKAAWALEVSLDVETSHAIAPMANVILVTTPTAETLGVQGFPQMMAAEQYVVDHHLANVISQSFASAEDAFGSPQSLLSLRHAYISAAQNGVTVLGSSGDGGTANAQKTPVGKGGSLIPVQTVEWPASDPLVIGVGGTYLCTDPSNTTARVVDGVDPPAKCRANPTQAEVGWTFSGGGFSHVFGKPAYQDTLPAGSTPIGSMRGVAELPAVGRTCRHRRSDQRRRPRPHQPGVVQHRRQRDTLRERLLRHHHRQQHRRCGYPRLPGDNRVGSDHRPGNTQRSQPRA
ncbi:MAG TPA: hypothetical protein VIN65_10215 [Candidatus Dormibacteraeota bacterium]